MQEEYRELLITNLYFTSLHLVSKSPALKSNYLNAETLFQCLLDAVILQLLWTVSILLKTVSCRVLEFIGLV